MAMCRPDRDRLIQAINLYASGRVKSDLFDVEVFESFGKNPDRAVPECATMLWSTYDDFKDESLFPNPMILLRMKRMVAFLASDLEYGHRPFSLMPIFNRNKEIMKPYWPFATQAEWSAHRRLSHLFQPDLDALIVSQARKG